MWEAWRQSQGSRARPTLSPDNKCELPGAALQPDHRVNVCGRLEAERLG
jgi:hypothetical protein